MQSRSQETDALASDHVNAELAAPNDQGSDAHELPTSSPEDPPRQASPRKKTSIPPIPAGRSSSTISKLRRGPSTKLGSLIPRDNTLQQKSSDQGRDREHSSDGRQNRIGPRPIRGERSSNGRLDNEAAEATHVEQGQVKGQTTGVLDAETTAVFSAGTDEQSGVLTPSQAPLEALEAASTEKKRIDDNDETKRESSTAAVPEGAKKSNKVPAFPRQRIKTEPPRGSRPLELDETLSGIGEIQPKPPKTERLLLRKRYDGTGMELVGKGSTKQTREESESMTAVDMEARQEPSRQGPSPASEPSEQDASKDASARREEIPSDRERPLDLSDEMDRARADTASLTMAESGEDGEEEEPQTQQINVKDLRAKAKLKKAKRVPPPAKPTPLRPRTENPSSKKSTGGSGVFELDAPVAFKPIEDEATRLFSKPNEESAPTRLREPLIESDTSAGRVGPSSSRLPWLVASAAVTVAVVGIALALAL